MFYKIQKKNRMDDSDAYELESNINDKNELEKIAIIKLLYWKKEGYNITGQWEIVELDYRFSANIIKRITSFCC